MGKKMGKLKTLGSRITAKPEIRLKSAPEVKNWGKGRGGRPWRRLREQVLLRDGYTCRQCGRVGLPENLQADHIINTARGGSNDLSNLQTLCTDCHAAKTAAESKGGGW